MNRIGYIDAMRGFSMILVVFGHVLLLMGFPTDSTVLGAVIMTFRMPLFFFVSGFFAYRPMEKWTRKMSATILKRKIQAQIVSTIVFYSIFQLCHSKSPLLFLSDGFSWFWFTIVLFQMFLVYMVLALLEHLTKKNYFVLPGLILCSVVSFVIFVKNPGFGQQMGSILSWYYFVEYFQFFAFGVLSRKFYSVFECGLRSNLLRTSAIVFFVIGLFVVYGFDRQLSSVNTTIYKLFQEIFVRYSGLLVVFMCFFANRNYFDKSDKVCRYLKFVGRRTLDIYMLHVFFLPDLMMLKPYLSGSGSLLMILTIGLFVAILNVALCLFVSLIIRSSTTLSTWLFGEKVRSGINNATFLP